MKKLVTVYTLKHCPYCVNAKSLLHERGVSFNEILVDENDEDAKLNVIKRSGLRTFPQIYHGDDLIGGFMNLSEMNRLTNLENLK